jgi:biotin operon repressor
MDIRTRIVTEWNKGKLSMTQIGAPIGLSRQAVSGQLTRAREAGMYVLSIDRHTRLVRWASALPLVDHPAYNRARRLFSPDI